MNLSKIQVIHLGFILVGVVFLIKLFFLQVVHEEYQSFAEKNIIQRVAEYPYRGLIYDRYGKGLVYNAPIYDLLVIPRNVAYLDTLAFCKDFSISLAEFKNSMQKAKKYATIIPSVFIKNISHQAFATIQDHLSEYVGFFIIARTTRMYTYPILSHTIGYMGEISPFQLALGTCHDYIPGNLVGKSGLEANYEAALRGKRGVVYKMVNAKGIEQGEFKNGTFDTLSTPGQNLTITIDHQLQLYGEQLMKNKAGSIVAIAPNTGEILAMVSAPTYAPNDLQGKKFSKNFAALEKDSLAPLFNRSIMAMHPPGSIFKVIQALIGLQEKVIQPNTTHRCNQRLVNCHVHPSPTNLYEAIKYSCNPYFCYLFKKILNQNLSKNIYEDTQMCYQKWYSYINQFNLGRPLGIDIPNEKGGYIPDLNFYDKIYGKKRWQVSTIRSLDIGQGEMLITPLQMANLAAIIANKGYYYTPHLIKKMGEQSTPLATITKHQVAIDAPYFALVTDAMHAASHAIAWRARIPKIDICTKTGTAENPHGPDHSVFIAFAPKDNPKIALVVYVENAGWGGRAAASIGGLIIEKYLKGTIGRKWIENYVLTGNFFH